MAKTDAVQLDVRERNALETPTDLDRKGVSEISSSLRQLLADVFALYVKTKNFHSRSGHARLAEPQSVPLETLLDINV